MRERKSEKELVIRIIITGADAEEPDEPEYWTEVSIPCSGYR